MRVSLAQPRHPSELTERGGVPAATLLASRAGPRVVLGGGETSPTGDFSRAIVPSETTLFGPRAAVLAAPGGPLVVADTGHHRILIWNRAPERDGAPADVVLGQPDFATEGRNARGAVTEATCNVPVGVAFTERGLLVADTGNRRVLVWDERPQRDGTPADRVLGQRDFATRDENGGAGCGASGMRWPHDLVMLADGRLVVADAGNNRLMLWDRLPETNGAPCDAIVGQRDAAGADHNGGTYWPTSSTLNMPYGCTVARDTLVIADTANSRLVGFRLDGLRSNAHASALAAQPDFLTKGDNRWGLAVRDSLCWPYGVSACGETLAIADSGNSRVVLWDLA